MRGLRKERQVPTAEHGPGTFQDTSDNNDMLSGRVAS